MVTSALTRRSCKTTCGGGHGRNASGAVMFVVVVVVVLVAMVIVLVAGTIPGTALPFPKLVLSPGISSNFLSACSNLLSLEF